MSSNTHVNIEDKKTENCKKTYQYPPLQWKSLQILTESQTKERRIYKKLMKTIHILDVSGTINTPPRVTLNFPSFLIRLI
jgi:hypothetical protein